MKTAWFPPKKPASESSNGFQSPLPRRRVSRIGRNFRVVEGKTSRNKPAISDGLFDHIEFLQAFPHIGAPIKGHPHVRRLLHSPLYVYYRLDENRGAIEFSTSGIAPEEIQKSEPRAGRRGFAGNVSPAPSRSASRNADVMGTFFVTGFSGSGADRGKTHSAFLLIHHREYRVALAHHLQLSEDRKS